jgi:hypothetical protein
MEEITKINIELIQICKAFNLGDLIDSIMLNENNGFIETQFITNKGIFIHYFKTSSI